jgi:hypothetical protein
LGVRSAQSRFPTGVKGACPSRRQATRPLEQRGATRMSNGRQMPTISAISWAGYISGLVVLSVLFGSWGAFLAIGPQPILSGTILRGILLAALVASVCVLPCVWIRRRSWSTTFPADAGCVAESSRWQQWVARYYSAAAKTSLAGLVFLFAVGVCQRIPNYMIGSSVYCGLFHYLSRRCLRLLLPHGS